MTPSEWSKAVVQRDGKCVDCGTSDPLHAHHVKPKSLHPELRFDLSNGVAVCPTCHVKRHNAARVPVSRATIRRPFRKTLEKQLAHWKDRAERAEARLAELGEHRRLHVTPWIG